MKTKTQKKEELKALEVKLPESSIAIFTTFAREGEKGLSVAQMQELKRALREIDSEYLVTKKTLVDKALKDLKYDGADLYSMDGSLGIVIGKGDSYAIAKKLYEFAKKNAALQFFGAILEKNFIDKAKLSEMALMPSREVLLGRLMGMMRYPLTGLAIVLKEIAKKSESGSPAQAAPAEAQPEAQPQAA